MKKRIVFLAVAFVLLLGIAAGAAAAPGSLTSDEGIGINSCAPLGLTDKLAAANAEDDLNSEDTTAPVLDADVPESTAPSQDGQAAAVQDDNDNAIDDSANADGSESTKDCLPDVSEINALWANRLNNPELSGILEKLGLEDLVIACPRIYIQLPETCPQQAEPTPEQPQPTTEQPAPTAQQPEVTAEPADQADNLSYEEQVVQLVNEERAVYGLGALTLSADLSDVARTKSQDMHDNNYFAHNSPTYGSPFDMMETFGITYRAAGENIAMGYATPEAVVEAWMNSEGHRANILNSAFTQIGVGYVADGSYWTQEFIG